MNYALLNPTGNESVLSIPDSGIVILPSVSRKRVELVATGKGGVGKTLIAGLIAQYRNECGEPVQCIDADPVNNTLSGVIGLDTEVVDLLTDETVNVTALDELISGILEINSNYVVDPGAAGYLPLMTYLMREGLFDLLDDTGKRVIVHAVVTGGESVGDTSASLADMADQLPSCVDLVAWMNPYWGPVEYEGVRIEETVLWKNLTRIHSIVRLPDLNVTTTLPTFRKLINARMTFANAAKSSAFNAVEKIRLSRIWGPLRCQIAAI